MRVSQGRLGEDKRGRGDGGRTLPRNLLADVLPPVASMRRRALHRRGKRGVRTCERHAKHRLVSRRRARGKGCDKNAPSDSATLARCAQTPTSDDRRDSSTGTGQRPESPRVASHGAAKAHASNGPPDTCPYPRLTKTAAPSPEIENVSRTIYHFHPFFSSSHRSPPSSFCSKPTRFSYCLRSSTFFFT